MRKFIRVHKELGYSGVGVIRRVPVMYCGKLERIQTEGWKEEGTCDLGLEGCRIWAFTNEESILSGCRKRWNQDIVGAAADRFISLAHVRGAELEEGCQVSGDIDLRLTPSTKIDYTMIMCTILISYDF